MLIRLSKILFYLFTSDPKRIYNFFGVEDEKRLNLGWWNRSDLELDQACDDLIRQVGTRARLSADDHILDVGFGFGIQDQLWVREFGCKRIVGINITPIQVRTATELVRKAGLEDYIRYQLGDAARIPFRTGSFDKVIALECAFQFNTRQDFFEEALRVLKPGGLLVTADIIRGPFPASGLGRLVHGLYGFLHERFWQIPAANRYSSAEYRRRLTATGFSAIQLEDVTDRVIVPYGDSGRALFPPSSHFKRFWAKPILWETRKFFRSGYFQYILAAAQKPDSVLLD